MFERGLEGPWKLMTALQCIKKIILEALAILYVMQQTSNKDSRGEKKKKKKRKTTPPEFEPTHPKASDSSNIDKSQQAQCSSLRSMVGACYNQGIQMLQMRTSKSPPQLDENLF